MLQQQLRGAGLPQAELPRAPGARSEAPGASRQQAPAKARGAAGCTARTHLLLLGPAGPPSPQRPSARLSPRGTGVKPRGAAPPLAPCTAPLAPRPPGKAKRRRQPPPGSSQVPRPFPGRQPSSRARARRWPRARPPSSIGSARTPLTALPYPTSFAKHSEGTPSWSRISAPARGGAVVYRVGS